MPHLAFKGKFGVFFSLIRRSKSISTTWRNVKMQTISQIFNWYKDKFDYTTSEFSLLVLGIITDEIYIYFSQGTNVPRKHTKQDKRSC